MSVSAGVRGWGSAHEAADRSPLTTHLLAEPTKPMLADGVEPLTLARMARHRLGPLEVGFRGLGVPERAEGGAERASLWREVEPADLAVGVELESEVVLCVLLDQEW